jgi:hypothetical protein
VRWRFASAYLKEIKNRPQSHPQHLSGARVIAKGKRIRDVRRLVAQYGGRASKWVKKSSPRFESDKEYFEIHWYEHPGMGRFEVKRVRVKRL